MISKQDKRPDWIYFPTGGKKKKKKHSIPDQVETLSWFICYQHLLVRHLGKASLYSFPGVL